MGFGLETAFVKRVVKQKAADLAVAVLREHVVSGEWNERLPGARLVARKLGLSPQTVAAALCKLVEEGLIEKCGERRAFRVVKVRSKASSGGSTISPSLLILMPTEFEQLEGVSRIVLEKLREAMVERGWKVDHQVVDFLHAKRMQRSWDQKIRVDEATSVVALYGRPSLAEWSLRREVRMCFLGGGVDGLPMPIVAVRASEIARVALEHLVALGHWRIVLPLCDRVEGFKKSMGDAMRVVIEGAGRTYMKTYHNPESAYAGPDVTWRIMESAFASNPPTALVLLDWKELVTAQCFLQRRGLRIPEDVSVVLLNDQNDAEWFFPELTRFRFPVRRIVNAMIRWLEGGKLKRENIPADFLTGKTMVPPPAK